jgi:hypothetical protein
MHRFKENKKYGSVKKLKIVHTHLHLHLSAQKVLACTILEQFFRGLVSKYS